MSVLALAEAEERVRLAQDALDAAGVRKDPQSMSLHQYRLMRAEEALTKARHADANGGRCGCHLCTGRNAWDD